MIDAEAGKIDKRILNLSHGMAAKAFIGSMSSNTGRSPVYRVDASFSTAPKSRVFGPSVGVKGLNESVLRDRISVISRMDMPVIHWNAYRMVTQRCGYLSNTYRLDASDVDVWGKKYESWIEGSQPKHNKHSKSKRNDLLQKEFHSICDGNGIVAMTRCYDGNTTDIEMNRDAIQFLKERIDVTDSIIVADCKLAVTDIISDLIGMDLGFVTKVPVNFNDKVKDSIVYSAVNGTMDESEKYKGRFLYDTDADMVLDDGSIVKLRFVAFKLPGGKEQASDYLRTQGLSTFTRRVKSLGKFYCEKDAAEAFRKATDSAYAGVFTAEAEIYEDKRLVKKDPEGPHWRVRPKNIRMVESALDAAAEAFSVRVLATNLPRTPNDTPNLRSGATADQVVDLYLGQYRIEFAFRMMKSGMGVGHLYVHSPSRQDAIIFLSSLATMIHGIIDNALARTDTEGDPNVNPYVDGQVGGVLTMKHISDFMSNVYVKYNEETGNITISGYPGAAAEVQDILERLQLDPKLLLGY